MRQYANRILNFGKHKGQRINDLEVSYLLWVYNNFAGLNDDIKRDIAYVLDQKMPASFGASWSEKCEEEIRYGKGDSYYRRTWDKSSSTASQSKSTKNDSAQLLLIITRVRNTLARKWHPDKINGERAGMQAINDFFDALKSEFERM